jgi:hypothetical protein
MSYFFEIVHDLKSERQTVSVNLDEVAALVLHQAVGSGESRVEIFLRSGQTIDVNSSGGIYEKIMAKLKNRNGKS